MTQVSPPGVLLLISDDWSPLAGCYGHRTLQTPHIDRLAERATVFDRAFCTTPSCAASRANLLTGLYAHQHGQYGHTHGFHGFRTHESLADQTLPALLNRHHIATGLIGKDHIAPHAVYPFTYNDRSEPWFVSRPAESARRFFQQHATQPFFLQVASMYPHRTAGNFDHHRVGGDEMISGDTTYAPDTVDVPAWLPDTPTIRQDLADYYRFVSRYDRFVGAILEKLRLSGRAENTLVIVMTDHGMPFPGAKASPYDSGHHCPLIISRPGGRAQRTNALVNWCDLFPTVCESLGVSCDGLQKPLPGRSLLPVLDQPEAHFRDAVYFSHVFHEVTNYFPYRVIRGDRYKLIHHLASGLPMPMAEDLFQSPTWQQVVRERIDTLGVRRTRDMLRPLPEAFYDLQTDPHESTNLIDDPGFQPTIQAMRQNLLAFRQETHDPWLQLDTQREAHASWFAPI